MKIDDTTEVLILVGAADELREDEGRKVCAPGVGPIAVFRVGDEFHAISDTCTHGAASLSEGWIEGFEIECPVHSGRFDIRTGEPLSFPVTEPVATYRTKLIDGQLYIVV